MIFPYIILLVALAMEVIGSVISIIGLSSSLGNSYIVITMVIIVDIAKIVAISALIQYWDKINILLKSLLTIVTLVLITFTSFGVFGYLSNEFNKTISPNKELIAIKQNNQFNIEQLKHQNEDLIIRRNFIDNELSNASDKNKTKLLYAYDAEKRQINKQINDNNRQIVELNKQTLLDNHNDSHAIMADMISNWFNIPIEKSMKWIIIAFTLVFDPFAILMVMLSNILLKNRKVLVTQLPYQTEDLSRYKLEIPEKKKRPYTRRKKFEDVTDNTEPIAEVNDDRQLQDIIKSTLDDIDIRRLKSGKNTSASKTVIDSYNT